MGAIQDLGEVIREIIKNSGSTSPCRDCSAGGRGWEGILKSFIRNIAKTGSSSGIRTGSYTAEKPVLFAKLLYPFVSAGEEALTNKMKSYRVSGTYLEGAKKLLLETLSMISQNVFFHEFSGIDPLYKYKSTFDLLIEDNLTEKNTNISRDKYNSYIQSMLSGDYIDFFVKYPVLAKLMATATLQWVDFVSEFFAALEKDRHEIAMFFFNNEEISDSSITVSFDEANIFRCFNAVIEFENNKVIYKPRNIHIDESFYQLIQWLNKRTGGTRLKAVKVLSRDNYGWAEYAGYFQCETEEQVRNFYKRSGMLLGILYVFGSIDMHYRNLITSGEYPVLIDLEGLAGTKDDWDILDNFFLPASFINRNGLHVSYNALAAETVTETYEKNKIWSNINTDSMRLEYGHLPEIPKSLVKLNGEKVFSYNYSDQVLDGFSTIYSFIMNNSNEFLAKVRQLFQKDKVRYFFRNHYPINIFLQPGYLKSVNGKNPVIEKLAGGLAAKFEQPVPRRVTEYEYESLCWLTIPRFYISMADGRFESIEDLSVADLARCIPFASIEKKVKSLGRQDYQKQCRIIENIFTTYRNYYE